METSKPSGECGHLGRFARGLTLSTRAVLRFVVWQSR